MIIILSLFIINCSGKKDTDNTIEDEENEIEEVTKEPINETTKEPIEETVKEAIEESQDVAVEEEVLPKWKYLMTVEVYINDKKASAPYEVIVGESTVKISYQLKNTSDSMIPQVAIFKDDVKKWQKDLASNKSTIHYRIDVKTDKVTPSAAINKIEFWTRKENKKQAFKFWGTGAPNYEEIVIKVLPKPVIETSYKYEKGIKLVGGNITVEYDFIIPNAALNNFLMVYINDNKLTPAGGKGDAQFSHTSNSIIINGSNFKDNGEYKVIVDIKLGTHNNSQRQHAGKIAFSVFVVNGKIMGNIKDVRIK